MSIVRGDRPSILVVGDANRPEFSNLVPTLKTTADCWYFTQLEPGIAWLNKAPWQPELILLVQSQPGEIGDAEVRRLQTAAPLSGMCAVLGSWCEGETRSGRPWPGVRRCFQHEWPLLWRAELRRKAGGEAPLWTLPATTSDEERLLAGSRLPGELPAQGSIAVVAGSRESTGALSDACRAGGWTVASGDANPAVILWDTTIDKARNVQQVAAIKAQWGGAPVIALVTFPRPGDTACIIAAGIDAVLGKPFLLDHLFAEMRRII